MQAVKDYLAAWNAADAEARHHHLMSCVTPDVMYLDPHIVEPVYGIEELQALIERFRQRFDHRLEPEAELDIHHQVFRLAWRLQRESGAILSRGLMVGDLTATGLIQRVVHFVDRT
ncbi:MAG: nuclear transport factor 2 family protein [Elainella sp.]